MAEARSSLLFVPQSASPDTAAGFRRGALHPTTLPYSGTPWDQRHPHSQAATNWITFTVLLIRLSYFNINVLPD